MTINIQSDHNSIQNECKGGANGYKDPQLSQMDPEYRHRDSECPQKGHKNDFNMQVY